ncbi:hypothetical protein G3N95_24750 [Paraburkholderia sp. Tr-20389]|nr:hypothetical protein [Paraburkholderia sp. Tr-20389]MBN3756172.1 hypothetical protein [Paraburkholderia sp. Tr-20389]
MFEKGSHQVDVLPTGDCTHARNMDTGQPLPRISPLRAMVGMRTTF